MEEEPVEIYMKKKMITDINKVGGINSEKGIFESRNTVDSGENKEYAHNTHRTR